MGIDHLAKYGKPRKPPALGECFEVSDLPARFVEFRDRANNAVTVQYSTLSVVACNPSTELKLRFGKLSITITGSNLLPLVPVFSERRVTLCKQEDHRGDSADEPLPAVTHISLPDSIKPTDWKANASKSQHSP